LTQLEDQADAVLVRQPKIDDQYVKLTVDCQPLGGLAIRCRFHLIPRFFKRRSQKALYIDFILDEQKPHEGIIVYSRRNFSNYPCNETGFISTLRRLEDEHIVMQASAFRHAT
jgi:hypothetical protein